jgi:hypothetical protein
VPLVEHRRGIGGDGWRRQPPLLAAHLGFFGGKTYGEVVGSWRILRLLSLLVRTMAT